MSKEYWNGVLNRLPNFLQQTGRLCLGIELMQQSSRFMRGYPCLFPPMYRQPYMPYQLYPYQSNYPTTATPPYVRQETKIQSTNGISSAQNTTLGNRLINSNEETLFVTNSWKTLDNKQNKTQAEKLNLLGKYRGFVSNLGKSFVAAIDNGTGSDKNGYISIEEFRNYYISQTTPANGTTFTEEELTQLTTKADKIYNVLDLSKEGKLDWKEASALLALADNSGTSGHYNGVLKREDILKVFDSIVQNDTAVQTKLKANYQNLFNKIS